MESSDDEMPAAKMKKPAVPAPQSHKKRAVTAEVPVPAMLQASTCVARTSRTGFHLKYL